MANYPQYGNYGISVDPDLLRRAKQGPGLGDTIDAGIKALTTKAVPVTSNAYGVGATPSVTQPVATPMESRWSALTATQSSPAQPMQPIAQPVRPVAAAKPAVELQPIAQMPPVQPQVRSFDAMSGNRLSVMDQGNGGTVDGNVAAINRQTDAMHSLREARNPGITSGANQGAFGDIVSIGRAGESFGDDAMRSERIRGLIGDATTGRGFSRGQRSAMIDGAQALATMNQSPGVTRLVAQGIADPYKMAQLKLDTQRLGIDQQTNATKLATERERLALDQQRFGLDQQKAGLGALRQSALDQSTLARNARPTPEQIKAELQRRYLAGGPDAQQALAHLQKLFPSNNPDLLAGLGQ